MAALVHTSPLLPLHLNSYEINGKYYVFKYKEQLDKSEFDKQNPLLCNEEISTISNGTFTWTLGRNKMGKPVFYARQATDVLELFSKHITLFLDISCENPTPYYVEDKCIYEVEFAGELTIQDGQGKYNLLSGTYMKHKTINPEVVTALLTTVTNIPMMYTNISMITKRPNIRYLYGLNVLNIYEFTTKEEADVYIDIKEQMKFVNQGIKLAKYKKNEQDVEILQVELSKLQAIADKPPIQLGGKRKTRKRTKY
jgi:hypothetical protein